ncbi:hypothetical protein FRC06_005450, partial [Ceratobasidium sp. 370]
MATIYIYIGKEAGWLIGDGLYELLGSDDTGEEEPQLRREIAAKNKQLADHDVQLVEKEHRIGQLTEQLAEKDRELSQLKNDLAEKLSIIGENQEALRQANESLTSQRAELTRIRAENANDRLERDLAQQKEETDGLRNKMESFEQLFLQWFVQRSGEGWRFRNCKSGQFLTVSNTDDFSEVYCGKHPISWELVQGPRDHDVYLIKFAGCNRMFDLDKNGAAHNGNRVTLCQQVGSVPHQRWKFERLNDDTGEEDQRISREIAERDQRLAAMDQQLATQGQQLADKTRQIVDKNAQLTHKDHQLARMAEQLAIQGQEIAQVNSSLRSTQAQMAEVTERLRSKEEELDRLRRNDPGSGGEPSGRHAFRDALSQANDSIRDRDIELLKLQNQMLREKVDNEAYRQQREIRDLRENMVKLEQLVAQ